MIGLLCFALAVLASPFKSKLRLEAENAVLRHQLIVLKRRLRGRVRLTNNDRWFLIQLYRWFPSILQVLTIIRPETLVRWHRAGFRCYWRWKSRPLGGRPQIETELRALIRRVSSNHTPSLADFTTTTPELKFSVLTGPQHLFVPSEKSAISTMSTSYDQETHVGVGIGYALNFSIARHKDQSPFLGLSAHPKVVFIDPQCFAGCSIHPVLNVFWSIAA